ncbi:unnamed protein product, partial [Didymodactylos carnosus]
MIKPYQESIGQCRAWNGPTSTSKNRQKAETLGNTLFIIDATDFGGIEISTYSDFPHEEEVLLLPETSFTVIDVKADTKTKKTSIYLKTHYKKELEQLCTQYETGELRELIPSSNTSINVVPDRRFVIVGLNSDEFTSIIGKLRNHTEHLIIQINTVKEFEEYVNSNTEIKITIFIGNQQFFYFSSIIQHADTIDSIYVLGGKSDTQSMETNMKIELRFTSVNDFLSELVDQLANEYREKAEFLERHGEISLANEKHDIGRKIYETWMTHAVQPS